MSGLPTVHDTMILIIKKLDLTVHIFSAWHNIFFKIVKTCANSHMLICLFSVDI